MEFIDLPSDVLLEIASWLGGEDVLRLACTCKTMNSVLKDEWLWERLVCKNPSGDKVSSNYRLFYLNHCRKDIYLISSPNSFETSLLKTILRSTYRLVSCPSETVPVLVNVNHYSVEKYFGGRDTLRDRIKKFLEDGIPVIFLNCRVNSVLGGEFVPSRGVFSIETKEKSLFLTRPKYSPTMPKIPQNLKLTRVREEHVDYQNPGREYVPLGNKKFFLVYLLNPSRGPFIVFNCNEIQYHTKGKFQLFVGDLIEAAIEKCLKWKKEHQK